MNVDYIDPFVAESQKGGRQRRADIELGHRRTAPDARHADPVIHLFDRGRRAEALPGDVGAARVLVIDADDAHVGPEAGLGARERTHVDLDTPGAGG